MSPQSNTTAIPSSARVLVVDGDDDTRALYCDVLTGAGYEVVEACDGREAVAKALMHPPTLIITETKLPFVSGYALCETVRRDRATASVPILVITADARVPQTLDAERAGANLVLVKPVDIEIIVREIRRLIDNSADPRPDAR
jgi:CheY-like chemotaxis protein